MDMFSKMGRVAAGLFVTPGDCRMFASLAAMLARVEAYANSRADRRYRASIQ